MKRKFRILSLLMMTVVAMTFCTMTANGSDSGVSLDGTAGINTPVLISEDPVLIIDDGQIDASADQIENTQNKTAIVSVDKLNLRCGISTEYNVVKILTKGQKVSVIAQVGSWYIVQEQAEGYVGCVNGKYISFDLGNDDNAEKKDDTGDKNIPQDAATLLALVNSVRKSNGLKELTYNAELSRVATHKAMDMVENNYFSHDSKIYGTPFQMIKSYGISFSAAAENIAGNQSVERAFDAWMKSQGHSANILNSNYTETGIGIYKSPVYGLVLVQMFITP